MNYKPKSDLGRFGQKIFNLLVENFPQTFYSGGTARDFLLGKKIIDIDIATSAKPQEIIKLLDVNRVTHTDNAKNFGVIAAKRGNDRVEIASFRKDAYFNNRYPVVKFVKTPQQDSQRRDFTINSLYFSPKTGKILDFHNGLNDIKNGIIRFIGEPETRIEDPLRIIRALRFALDLHFIFGNKSFSSIKKYFYLRETLTKNRLETEIKKIRGQKNKLLMKKILANQKQLDIIFKLS